MGGNSAGPARDVKEDTMNRPQPNHAGTRTWTAACCLAVAVSLLLGWLAPVPSASSAPNEKEEEFFNGGNLGDNVDSDVDSLIRTAHRYMDEAKWKETIKVLQHVLDEYGSVLTTTDGQVYYPVRDKIEQMIGSLPPDGLATYRLMNDGDAEGLVRLATPENQIENLNTVVTQYFVTSIGDEAAFKLGCLLMDRYDFEGARRVFNKLLRHPDLDDADADIRPHDVHLRLAVACARVRDRDGAAGSWHELETKHKDAFPDDVLRVVKQEVDDAYRSLPISARAQGDWKMRLGNPSRTGLMPDLPVGEGKKTDFWTTMWINEGPHWSFVGPGLKNQPIHRYNRNKKGPQTRQQLVGRWESMQWTPTGQSLIYTNPANDRTYVLFKTNTHLYYVDAFTGKMIWKVEERQPEFDGSKSYYIHGGYYAKNSPDRPATPEEILTFGARRGRTFTIVDETVYTLEGDAWKVSLTPTIHVRIGNQNRPPNIPVSLKAVEAKSGKKLWASTDDFFRKQMGDENAQWNYLAPPIAIGERLIVPIEENDGVWLVNLDPTVTNSRGWPSVKIRWKRFLCADASTGSSDWSPVGMAVEGNDVYVATGRGLVFAVDGMDGSLRWASRYKRDVAENTSTRRFGVYKPPAPVKGFDEDIVIPRGGMVLLCPSDAQSIIAFDRATGEVKKGYPVKEAEANYVLGVQGDGLYVAGSGVVRRYDITNGKQTWPKDNMKVGRMLGRGVLTAEAVYVPVNDTIRKLSLDKGETLAQVKVDTRNGDPLGNLASDGDFVFVVGLDRAYALVQGEKQLAMLDRRIDSGDLSALLNRAELFRSMDEFDKSIADLRRVLTEVKGDATTVAQARAQLYETLLANASAKPDEAAPLLEEAESLAKGSSERIRVKMARGDWYAKRGRVEEALELYVAAAGEEAPVMIEHGDEEGLETLAANLASSAVRDLVREHGELVSTILEEDANKAFELAVNAPNRGPLERVARSYPGTKAGIAAAIEVAVRSISIGRSASVAEFERGENMLQQLAGSEHPATAATGLAYLADVHETKDWKRQAYDEWTKLARDHVGVSINFKGQTVLADELAAKRMEKLQSSPGDIDPFGVMFGNPPYKRVWRQPKNYYYLVNVGDTDDSQFLDEHVYLLNYKNGELSCTEARTGKATFKPVKLNASSGSTSVSNYAVTMWRGNVFPGGQMVRDGHIGLIWTDKGITSIGLVSGKRVWSKDVAAAKGSSIDVNQLRSIQPGHINPSQAQIVSAGGGVLAERVTDPKTRVDMIRVIDIVDGTLLWQRSFTKHSIHGVEIAGGYVNVVMDNGKHMWSLDKRTGLKASEITLKDRVDHTPLVLTRYGAVYQSQRGISLCDYETGKLKWVAGKQQKYDRLFKYGELSDDRMYFLTSSRNLFVVDMDTGKVKQAADHKTFKGSVYTAAPTPDGKAICAIGYGSRGTSMMTMVEADTGKAMAQIEFGKNTGHLIAASSVVRCKDYIPYAKRDDPKVLSGGRRKYVNTWQVYFYKKPLGKKPAPIKLPLVRNDNKIDNLRMPPLVRGGALILFGNDGLQAFASDPDAAVADEKKTD